MTCQPAKCRYFVARCHDICPWWRNTVLFSRVNGHAESQVLMKSQARTTAYEQTYDVRIQDPFCSKSSVGQQSALLYEFTILSTTGLVHPMEGSLIALVHTSLQATRNLMCILRLAVHTYALRAITKMRKQRPM